jgi:membrane protein required for colicin V production
MAFLNLSLIFDFALLLVAGYFIFRGARSGVVNCLFSLIALLIAFPIACYAFPLFAALLPREITERLLDDTIAFATTLIALYFLTLFLIWGILKAYEKFRQDISEQIAGGILGLMKGIVVIVIIILFGITFFPGKSPVIKNSFISHSTVSIANSISKLFPRSLRIKFIQKRRELELHWKQPRQGK